MKSIEVVNLEFSYNSLPFFRNFCLAVERGEIVGLIGPNGSGKTTLINLIRGYLSPDEGQIRLFGRNAAQISRVELGRILSLVPQESSTAFNFTAYEIVMMGRYPHKRFFQPSAASSDHDIVMEALRFTDSERFAHRYFRSLSGGEKQRIILARAIAQQAEIILLDEPTSSLDMKQAINIYKAIERLNRTTKVTILAATHDIHLVRKFCPRIVMLKDGAIYGDGPPEALFRSSPLERLYDIET
ncbi:MAG: ABC transporter ATP-binding protein [Acidobacteriota bacterium]